MNLLGIFLEVKKLKNAPLIEVVFELKWQLSDYNINVPGLNQKIQIDPYYEELWVRLKEKTKEIYPFYQPLPNLYLIPKEISKYVVLHQLRTGEVKWPLIQLGPGILTLNHGEAEGYSWSDFEQRLSEILKIFYEIHPKPEDLKIFQTNLRYLNATKFDFANQKLLSFLKEKMKIGIDFDENLFGGQMKSVNLVGLDSKFAFKLKKPVGVFTIRFARIKREFEELFWEMLVTSTGDEAPKTSTSINKWAKEAHLFTHNWFMKMIEGDLEEMFK